MADDPEFDAVVEEVAAARKPDTETPRPQRVRIVGDLEMIGMSGRGFELLLDDSSHAACILVEGDIADLKPLVGHRVLVQGLAYYRPSGHLLRIDVDRVGPGHGESDIWSVIPAPRKRTITRPSCASRKALRAAYRPSSGSGRAMSRMKSGRR